MQEVLTFQTNGRDLPALSLVAVGVVRFNDREKQLEHQSTLAARGFAQIRTKLRAARTGRSGRAWWWMRRVVVGDSFSSV